MVRFLRYDRSTLELQRMHHVPSADIIVDLVSVNRHGGLSGSGSVVVSILV